MSAVRNLVLVVVLALSAAFSTPASAASESGVSVELDRQTVSIGVGERFTFTTKIRNDGDQPTSRLVMHLNIASLDPNVYVDPEDWSADRTQYLESLPAHTFNDRSWSMQAVGSGRFVVYVGVAQPETPGVVVASPPMHLQVTQRQTLSSGSVLPLAASVPAGVLVLLVAAARRRRRLR